jgi:transcription initiation factor TFIID subunit 8
VAEAMHASRRTHPIPPDFEFALRRAGLSARHLLPHLKHPIPAATTRVAFAPSAAPEELPETPPALLGPELDGNADKLGRRYMAAATPPFPPRHTYRSTPVVAARDTDLKRVREAATREARAAEDALRRLMRTRRRDAVEGGRLERRARWDAMMRRFEAAGFSLGDDERCGGANWARQFYRR